MGGAGGGRGTHLLAAAVHHDGLVELVQVDLAPVAVRRRVDRLAALAHDLEERLHEELRVELVLEEVERRHGRRRHHLRRRHELLLLLLEDGLRLEVLLRRRRELLRRRLDGRRPPGGGGGDGLRLRLGLRVRLGLRLRLHLSLRLRLALQHLRRERRLLLLRAAVQVRRRARRHRLQRRPLLLLRLLLRRRREGLLRLDGRRLLARALGLVELLEGERAAVGISGVLRASSAAQGETRGRTWKSAWIR